MKVLFISHSSVVDVYQDKLRHLGRREDCELHLLIPRRYLEGSRVVEGFSGTGEYTVHRLDTWFGEQGRQNLHIYRGVKQLIRRIEPDIIHLEEEPESLVSWQVLRAAAALNKQPKIVLFTWRNMDRRQDFFKPGEAAGYIQPRVENYVNQRIDALISGTDEGIHIFRDLGLNFPIYHIPQYGVNPDIYKPLDVDAAMRNSAVRGDGVVVGFVGRLMQMKGIATLLQAFQQSRRVHSDGSIRDSLLLLGSGPDKESFAAQADELGIAEAVNIVESVPAVEVPKYLNLMDIMVLPSLTTPKWKEQFGRVLIEGMACGAAIIGSSSGEIPHVIGEAGRVFKEGDVKDLAGHLKELIENDELRSQLQEAGKRRVAEYYTNERIAARIYEVYCDVLR